MRRNVLNSNGSLIKQTAHCWSTSRTVSTPATLRRWARISPNIPAQSSPSEHLPITPTPNPLDGPDAKFEVLGAPFSLLSASLSASQNLYTRRGTLVGLSGKAENVISTLSMLEPFRRAVLRIPFFYQKITSASPVTALIATKSPISSFAVVHLDGTTDWTIVQADGLLAWTGQTISITPVINLKLNVGYWGNSRATGRGLLALTGKGQIYEVVLKAEEHYVAHPSHVLAYSMSRQRPTPYRFKSNVLRFEIPGLGNVARMLPDTKFFKDMRESDTWKLVANTIFKLRTWSRRTIFGDRLFLNFQGPCTILLQTRGSRLRDSLTNRDVNEIAEAPAGAIQDAIKTDAKRAESENKVTAPLPTPTRISYAGVQRDGSVDFQSVNRSGSG